MQVIKQKSYTWDDGYTQCDRRIYLTQIEFGYVVIVETKVKYSETNEQVVEPTLSFCKYIDIANTLYDDAVLLAEDMIKWCNNQKSIKPQ